MNRNVTAIYRTRDVAELTRRGLEEMGVPARDIHVIPDPTHDIPADRAVETSDTRTTTGTGAGAAPAGTTTAGARAGAMPGNATAGRLESDYSDRLHDLHLPEEDLRTYQNAVRRGDYVVSVEIEDHDVGRVQEIMRRPEEEVYRLEDRETEFRGETVVPHSLGEGHMINEDARAKRIASHDDPYARTYERGVPLPGAQRNA